MAILLNLVKQGWAFCVIVLLFLVHGGQQGWALLTGSPIYFVHDGQQGCAVLLDSLLCSVLVAWCMLAIMVGLSWRVHICA